MLVRKILGRLACSKGVFIPVRIRSIPMLRNYRARPFSPYTYMSSVRLK